MRGKDGGALPQAWHVEATFYAWKAKFGGMDVSDAKRLKVLAEENARLKRLLAEAMLLKDLLSRKW